MTWQAEVSGPFNFVYPSKIQAGEVLGRCHAKLGQHSLSTAAFDAALELAREGRYVWSEMATARARAQAGRDANGVGEHWSVYEGRERMAAVAGRMELGVGEARAGMEAALFGA